MSQKIKVTIKNIVEQINTKEQYAQVYKEIETFLSSFIASDGIEPSDAISLEGKRQIVSVAIIEDVYRTIQETFTNKLLKDIDDLQKLELELP